VSDEKSTERIEDPESLWGQSVAAQKEELTGFNGALLLVAIGRILAPFLLLWNFYNAIRIYSSPTVWRVLMIPGSPRYHPLWPVTMSLSCFIGAIFCW